MGESIGHDMLWEWGKRGGVRKGEKRNNRDSLFMAISSQSCFGCVIKTERRMIVQWVTEEDRRDSVASAR